MHWLQDLERVSESLCVSVPPFVKWVSTSSRVVVRTNGCEAQWPSGIRCALYSGDHWYHSALTGMYVCCWVQETFTDYVAGRSLRHSATPTARGQVSKLFPKAGVRPVR